MVNRTERQQQQTVFLLSGIAGACAIYFQENVFLYPSILLAFIGAFSLLFTKWVDFFWMKLAWMLGAIIPRILLSGIFYFFLTPIALLSRIFGDKDPLLLHKQSGSIFRDRVGEIEKTSYEKPW